MEKGVFLTPHKMGILICILLTGSHGTFKQEAASKQKISGKE